MAKSTKITKADREERIASLRELLGSVGTIYTCLRKVSSSGMSRTLTLHIVKDGEILDITYGASIALGWSRNDDGHLKVSGCGMDMGFHTVYTLAQILNDDGYSIKQRWM